MSTTNRFDETNEEKPTRRRRIEVTSGGKRIPVRKATTTNDVFAGEEVKPAIRKEISRSNGKASSDTEKTNPLKEQRRRRALNAEMEMTKSEKLTRRQQKKQRKEEKRRNKKPRLRIFPIWLRIIIIGSLSVVALGVGLMVGYGGLGEGEPKDALKWETWQHVIDIVKKEK